MADFDDEIVIKDASGRFKVLRGGKFYDLEPPKVKRAVPPLTKLVDQILEKGKIKVAENLKVRLEEIIEAYQKDVRDKFETKTTLMREVGAGGMGFSSEQADLVMRLVKREGLEEVKEVKEIKEVKEAKGAVIEAAPPGAMLSLVTGLPTPTPAVSSGVAEFVFSPADEAEILAHQKQLPNILTGLKPIEVAKFINEIIHESGLILDEVNRKKLENILLTHFKDIRDGFETKETILRVAEPTGIVLSPEQAEKILKISQRKLQELENKLKKTEVKKIRKAIEEEEQTKEAGRLRAEEKVKEKIDERWQEITKRPPEAISLPTELISPPIALRPKVLTLVPPAPPSVLRVSPPQVVKPAAEEVRPTGEEVKVKEVEKKKGLKVEGAEKAPTVGVVPAKIEMAPVKLKAEERPKPLEIFKPITPQVRRPIPRKEGRPRLDDIKRVPKLIGPIEELRETSLVDFRRLGTDASEAAAKIKAKINLLEKESVGQKTAGIKAWRDSEVFKLYLEISRESLSKGVPASQVIAERTAKSMPTLTQEEYQAVMDLNRSLRY